MYLLGQALALRHRPAQCHPFRAITSSAGLPASPGAGPSALPRPAVRKCDCPSRSQISVFRARRSLWSSSWLPHLKVRPRASPPLAFQASLFLAHAAAGRCSRCIAVRPVKFDKDMASTLSIRRRVICMLACYPACYPRSVSRAVHRHVGFPDNLLSVEIRFNKQRRREVVIHDRVSGHATGGVHLSHTSLGGDSEDRSISSTVRGRGALGQHHLRCYCQASSPTTGIRIPTPFTAQKYRNAPACASSDLRTLRSFMTPKGAHSGPVCGCQPP